MPELPEVTALAGALAEHLTAATVESLSMRSVAALKTFDPPLDALRGRVVTGCTRHGKFLDLQLDPLHLVVHLARAGWLRLVERETTARPSLRGPLVMVVGFRDGRSLQITEQGTEHRLAIYVVRHPNDVPGIARLGPDALDGSLTPEALGGLLRSRPGNVKAALADQSLIAGIGNAYSDEILHATRMSPFRSNAALTDDEIAALHDAMSAVLRDATAAARDGAPTRLKQEKRLRMRVHGRTGQACPICGDVVRQVALASRSFQYCATCQTGGKIYADRRMSKLLR
ncbi:MAG: Fpg/Nei family DNA glycosylase [Candidatus Dormibacteria bacterium]